MRKTHLQSQLPENIAVLVRDAPYDHLKVTEEAILFRDVALTFALQCDKDK